MARQLRLTHIANCIGSLLIVLIIHSGCGFERLSPALPDELEGLSLEKLEMIQSDERLTDDEKRDAIREAADIPDTEEGDRLIDFLLTFNVP